MCQQEAYTHTSSEPNFGWFHIVCCMTQSLGGQRGNTTWPRGCVEIINVQRLDVHFTWRRGLQCRGTVVTLKVVRISESILVHFMHVQYMYI